MIMSQRRDLTEEELLQRIEKRKADAGGLLSDHGAAILVAQDLHIEMQREGMEDIRIENLVTGLSDVSVVGRITNVQPIQEFKRQGGAIGKVNRFQLMDSSGRINCVAWDQAAENAAKRDLEGRIVRISHGYTREGLPGKPELHIGEKGMITVDPTGVRDEDIPSTEALLTTIEDVKRSTGETGIMGVVKTPPRIVSFKRAGGEGKVLRTKLIDGTGRITLVAWNEKASELENLKKGDAVEIVNGRLKTGLAGRPEIHADSRSQVTILPEPPKSLQGVAQVWTKLDAVSANMRDLDVQVQVLKVEQPREVTRNTGEKTKVASLLLGDATGIIRASFWDDKAELTQRFKEGDVLWIEEAVSRERLGEISLSVGRSSYVTVNPEHEAVEVTAPAISLASLNEVSSAVIVAGTVVEAPVHRQVQTAKGETVDLTEFRLRDSSAERRVVFWRRQAQEAAKLPAGAKIRIAGALPRRGLTGEIELSSSPVTYFEVLQEAEAPQLEPGSRIIELKEGMRGVVQALIIEISNKSHGSMVCKNCGGSIEFEDEGMACDRCGPVEEAALSATLLLKIDDGSGFMDAVLRSPQSNTLLGEDSKWIERRMAEQRAPKVQLSLENLSRLIGMKVLVEGDVRRDAATGLLVFHSEKVAVVGSGADVTAS